MIARHGLTFIFAAVFLAGCGSQSEENIPNNSASPDVPENISEPDALSENSAGGNTAAPDAAAIPTAYQGRWGQVPADCEPGRSDAKGLLIITTDALKFYESSGKVGGVSTRTANRLVADFDMMGEGMEWNRQMAFDLSNGSKTLVRTESGAEVPFEPVTYQRCP